MKVLFLDSWTVGIHNFLPISSELEAKGVECLLVHRGSWGNEPDRPDEEQIDGLLCRDIRYYGTNLIHKVLEKEKPDVVLLLTTNTFIDRATILSARSLGIKSTFLMHGVVFVGEKREADMAGATKSHRSLRWKRARKYLRYVLPNYFFSGFRQDPLFPFKLDPYLLVWRSFTNPAKYYWAPPPSTELQCDQALVWANIYREHYHHEFGYPYESIFVVGPPPLDNVFSLLSSPPGAKRLEAMRSLHSIPKDVPICVYLETAAVEANIEGWTSESRRQHFDEMINCAAAAGRYLVVKLHPASSTDGLEEYGFDPRVKFIRNVELPLLIYAADSVIGFVSSTLDIAIVLNKPLVTPVWGICRNLPDDYLKNGVALRAESVDELIDSLRNPSRCLDYILVSKSSYIERYITDTNGGAISKISNLLIIKGVAQAD